MQLILSTPYCLPTGFKTITCSQEPPSSAFVAGVQTSGKADVLAFYWSGAFRCVKTQCQEGKRSENGEWSEEQLLLQISLEKVIKAFQKYLELQVENSQSSQQVYNKIRLCNDQRNTWKYKKPEELQPLLSTENFWGWVRFTNDLWTNVLWSDDITVKSFGLDA